MGCHGENYKFLSNLHVVLHDMCFLLFVHLYFNFNLLNLISHQFCFLQVIINVPDVIRK